MVFPKNIPKSLLTATQQARMETMERISREYNELRREYPSIKNSAIFRELAAREGISAVAVRNWCIKSGVYKIYTSK